MELGEETQDEFLAWVTEKSSKEGGSSVEKGNELCCRQANSEVLVGEQVHCLVGKWIYTSDGRRDDGNRKAQHLQILGQEYT